MTPDSELLPCPFCGSPDAFVQNAGWKANTFMRCPSCKTTFSLDNGTPRAHEDTVAAWNRRSRPVGDGEPVAWRINGGPITDSKERADTWQTQFGCSVEPLYLNPASDEKKLAPPGHIKTAGMAQGEPRK